MKPTSKFPHDSGKELFVDFAGDTLGYVNVAIGELIKVQTFVSTMACTDYAFALCVPSQKTEDFIHALCKALEFYGGVPRIVVPDKLKSAVIKADKYEPVLNKAQWKSRNFSLCLRLRTIYIHRMQGENDLHVKACKGLCQRRTCRNAQA